MKVKQLIEMLEKFPLDATVAVRVNEDGELARKVVLDDSKLYWKGDAPSTIHGMDPTNVVVITD